MLPNLIVIGAGKCGTSSLHEYLGCHPEISMSRPKELNFFVAELNWPKGVEWYASHFREDVSVRGESSVAYTEYPHHRGVPERMAGLVPEAKLVFLVRDPIERIVSSYTYNYHLRTVHGSIDDELVDPGCTLISKSRYWLQLEQYLRHFREDQILVIDSADLRAHRAETLRAVLRFLEVDDRFTSPRWDTELHPTPLVRRSRLRVALGPHLVRTLGWDATRTIASRLPRALLETEPFERPVLGQAQRTRLAELLADDVARLRAHTGLPFETWSL